MTIKHLGGVFGRHPTFNTVDVDGVLNTSGNVKIGGTTLSNPNSYGNIVNVQGYAPAVVLTESDTGKNYTLGINGQSLRFIEGTTVRTTFDTSGNLTVNTGNLVIGTSGKGIDFSATSGTGTSELFDDYEEGTWSPVYAPQSGSFTTMTMEIFDAVYTKIGNTVFISAFMRTDNVDMGTASGTLRITGLPFAPSSVVSTGGIEVSFAGGFGGDHPLSGWFESSYIQLSYRTSVNGTSLSSIVTDLTAGATANRNTLRISGMYKTAS
jgi:hypothetical protein